ncbi:hypothetical protein BH10ACT9_BH10ACT9_03820 [soil metagenome]
MNELPSEARKATTLPISSGRARRLTGTVEVKSARASSEPAKRSSKPGVSVSPGATTLTRILRSISSAAQLRPRERIAALDAA